MTVYGKESDKERLAGLRRWLVVAKIGAGRLWPLLLPPAILLFVFYRSAQSIYENHDQLFKLGALAMAAAIPAIHIRRPLIPAVTVAAIVAPLPASFMLNEYEFSLQWRVLLATLATIAVIDCLARRQRPAPATTAAVATPRAVVPAIPVLDYAPPTPPRVHLFIAYAWLACFISSLAAMAVSLYMPMHLGSIESSFGVGANRFWPHAIDDFLWPPYVANLVAFLLWLEAAIWLYRVILGKTRATIYARIARQFSTAISLAVFLLYRDVVSDYGLPSPAPVWQFSALMLLIATTFVARAPRAAAAAEADWSYKLASFPQTRPQFENQP